MSTEHFSCLGLGGINRVKIIEPYWLETSLCFIHSWFAQVYSEACSKEAREGGEEAIDDYTFSLCSIHSPRFISMVTKVDAQDISLMCRYPYGYTNVLILLEICVCSRTTTAMRKVLYLS